MRLEQLLVEQVGDTKPATTHLVFVSGTDSARGGANLYSSGCVFSGEFHHAVVGKYHVRAIGDEEIAVDLDAGLAQRTHFFHESERIEDDAVADDSLAALAQDAARNELQNEFLAVNSNGVSGVVSAGITRHNAEVIGEHIDDLAFALVTPLGAYYHRCLA